MFRLARHVINIPIIKGSNGNVMTVGQEGTGIDIINIPTISESLYLGNNCSLAVGWDNIPANKTIVSAELMMFSNDISSNNIAIKYIKFLSEGGGVAFTGGPDRGYSGINSGWNTFNLPLPMTYNAISMKYYADTSGYYGSIIFNSHRNSNNKPYLRLTYDDIPPENPKSLYPADITLNPRDIIRFSWLHDNKEESAQKGFSLQYSINSGSTWTTISQTTINQFYDMPASTLPTSGNVLWRIKTTDNNNTDSGYTTANFTLGVVPQQPPIPISPISQYLDENNPIKFEWNFMGGTGGETQSKFDLQYSINGGSSWATKTLTTSNNFYELAAKTLPSGNITWRVRTYNNWNEVSPYSENRSFAIIGSPPIPQILTITNNARPTFTWQSLGQHIYEIELLKDSKLIFKSGYIPSTIDRTFKMKEYLDDGNYLMRLRVLNEYNLNSSWAEKSFVISTVKPSKPLLEIYSDEYSVTINILNQSVRTLVYRDGVLLGEVDDDTFSDFTGQNRKDYKYYIRNIDINDNFADSDIKLAQCNFSGNTLALTDDPEEFIHLRYGFGNIPKKSNRNGIIANLNYYDGRKYPVVEYSEFRTKEKTLYYFLETKEELDTLYSLIDARKTLIYRDNNGENIYGVILNIDDEKTILGYEIGFTIIKTEV